MGGYSPPPRPRLRYWPCYCRSGFPSRWAPGTLEIFATSFLPNAGEDHEKSLDLSAEPLAGTAPYCGKSCLG